MDPDEDLNGADRSGSKLSSWRRRIDATSKITTARMKDSAAKVREQVLSTETGRKAAEWSAERGAAADERLDRFGETAAGKRVAGASRKVGAVMGKVPGVSATADSVSIRNGVDLLTQAVKDDPRNPEALLHLALALRRTEREMAQVAAAKAVLKPTTLVTRTVLRRSASLDGGPEMPMQEKLLRAAFKRASAVKAARPADADNLHTLARIYLVQRRADTARTLARLALAGGPSHPGDVYVTLAYVESSVAELDRAEHYAQLALKHGSTLGAAVLADLAMARATSATDKVRGYERWASMVDPAHEERYYGVRLEQRQRDVTRRLWQKHRAKAGELSKSVREQGSSLADQVRSAGHDEPAPAAVPAAAADPTAAPPGWYPDPLGRFEHRYWDGVAWTAAAATQGQQYTDPLA